MLSIVIDNIGLRFSKRGLFNLATQNFFENFAQKNIEKAIEESAKITNISSAVFTEDNQNRIAILEKRVDDLSMDGGEVIE